MRIPLIRYWMLVLGIGVLIPAILKGEMRDVVIAFLIGMPYGLLIDWVGAEVMRLWKYAGSLRGYFLITVPCWGVFDMAINLFWNWITPSWLAFIVVTIGLFAYLELPNLRTRSWLYDAPLWLVGLGWIPLILSFRILYVAVIYVFH